MASGFFTNANTESARVAALASFDLLQKRQVARANVHELINQDPSGDALASTIDQYTLYLVAVDGTRGKRLEQSTVTQYFRTVKNWLLDQHPGQEAPSRRRLTKSANSIKNSFKNAGQTGASRQAVACKKADLQAMADAIYQTASEEVDYHDAELLILMWYLIRRSSDMAFLSKENVTVTPSGSLTLRFGRVKTGVEQGLALYGDREFLSCPIHALAMAAVVERVPSDIIFRHLPKTFSEQDARVEYPDDLLLSEVFQQQIERAAVTQGAIRSAPNMLGWSLALRHKELSSRTRAADASLVPAAANAPPTQESKFEVLLGQHMELMHALLKQNAALEKRLATIEMRMNTSSPLTGTNAPATTIATAIEPTIKRRRAAPMTLIDVSILWYTSRPPLYDSKSDVSKQRFSDIKLVVAYMRMFLPNGYSLGSGAGGLSEARRIGVAPEADALRRHHLQCGHSGPRNGHVAAYGTVLKSLKELHGMGAFDVLIAELISRIDSGAITDPTPRDLLLPTQK